MFSFYYLFFISLSDDNINKNFSENDFNPKSRLLIDEKIKILEKKNKSKTYFKIESKIQNLNSDIKEATKENINNESEKNKINYNFTINFIKESEEPNSEDLKKFLDDISKLDRKRSISIVGYAERRKKDSTSKVRRLSLKRALLLRALLLENNYKISKIYVRALGDDYSLKGSKDVVIVSQN